MSEISASDALKAFDSDNKAEDVEPQSNFAPSIKIHDEDATNVGQFVSGRLLRCREIQKTDSKNMFIELRLEKTNAKATMKKGSSYVNVDVKEGDVVSIFASSRLYRAVSPLQPGTRVFFLYEGQKKVETPKGKKLAHIYKVKSLPGNLTADDLLYIKSHSKKQVSDKEVEDARKVSESEAVDAMNALED